MLREPRQDGVIATQIPSGIPVSFPAIRPDTNPEALAARVLTQHFPKGYGT